MYLIIRDDKPSKVLHECCRRERGELLPDYIVRIVSRYVVRLCRKLVFPTVIYDGLVVLLSVLFEKMFSEVRARGVFLVEIIGDSPWDLQLINAIMFAASLLEGGIAIRKAVLTCINCRLSVFPWHQRS